MNAQPRRAVADCGDGAHIYSISTTEEKTLETLRLHGVGDLRLHDEPEPTPSSGETLLRVTAVGLCGSDLHWFVEGSIGDAQLDRSLVLGHEFAGATVDGQRVAVDPAVPCGTCEFCLEGNPNLCLNLRFAGHGVEEGALREMMAWPTHCLYPIPDSDRRRWHDARTAGGGYPRG